MLKLILVDDEVFVRLGIKKTIDWGSIGYEIAGEAEDGQKALEMAREIHPDVVLTDIQMPKMNGLELIKALKIELPNTKTIVLSCHKDFDYVREAMQSWGALDYLLKFSIQPEDLIKVMKNVKESIEQERSRYNETLEAQWKLNANISDLRSKFINELLDGCIDISVLDAKQLKKMGVKIAMEGLYAALCIRFDFYYTVIKEQNPLKSKNLLIFSIFNIVDEIICNKSLNGNILQRNENEFGIIISFPASEAVQPGVLKDLSLQIVDLLKKYINVSVSIGISNFTDRIDKLGKVYSEAQEISEYRLFNGTGSINTYEDVFQDTSGCFFDSTIEKSLRTFLENRMKADAKNLLCGMFDDIVSDRKLSPMKLKNELTEIMNVFSSVVRQYKGIIRDVTDEKGNDPYTSLAQCETIKETRQWFDIFIEKYILYLERMISRIYSTEVEKAVEYINMSYTEDIRLKDVADYVHISETYLSIIFKKETGQYFTDYLNDLRIKKARELLKSGNINVTEVGEMVGYASTSYFSRVFKQLTGINPLDYKKNFKNS